MKALLDTSWSIPWYSLHRIYYSIITPYNLYENIIICARPLEYSSRSIHHVRVSPCSFRHIWQVYFYIGVFIHDITSQKCGRIDSPDISHNYSTNDKMVRYTRINEYIFVDNLFTTNNSGKSLRGHKLCNIFFTGKCYVHVVPKESKWEVMQVFMKISMEVGAPDFTNYDDAQVLIKNPNNTRARPK